MSVAVLSHAEPVAVVAALSGLGAPSFQPIQLAVLYGYRSGVVTAGVRWGWMVAPVGPQPGGGAGPLTRSLLEPERRFELLTCALRVRCSTD